MLQDSVECAGPRKHNGESLVFVHCMVLEIQLFFLIPSSNTSCFIEAAHLFTVVGSLITYSGCYLAVPLLVAWVHDLITFKQNRLWILSCLVVCVHRSSCIY